LAVIDLSMGAGLWRVAAPVSAAVRGRARECRVSRTRAEPPPAALRPHRPPGRYPNRESHGQDRRLLPVDERAGRVRPPPRRGLTAVPAHQRRPRAGEVQGAAARRAARDAGGDRPRPQTEALRGERRHRLRVRDQGDRSLPLQLLPAVARLRRGVPADPEQDHDDRAARAAVDRAALRDARQGPRAGHGRDRQRQVDDTGGDRRLRQQEPARPHPHHRGPDRVPALARQLPDQPPRARRAHQELRGGAARRAARGPGHHPGGRAARPGDDPARARGSGDRAPGARHAAHTQRHENRRSHHRRVPTDAQEQVRTTLSESLQAA
jgi:hypothetical protein